MKYIFLLLVLWGCTYPDYAIKKREGDAYYICFDTNLGHTVWISQTIEEINKKCEELNNKGK